MDELLKNLNIKMNQFQCNLEKLNNELSFYARKYLETQLPLDFRDIRKDLEIIIKNLKEQQ